MERLVMSSFVRSSRRISLCQDRPGALDHRSIDQFAIQPECSRTAGLDRFQDPPGPGPFGFGGPKPSIDHFYLFRMNTELAAKSEATRAYYIVAQPRAMMLLPRGPGLCVRSEPRPPDQG